MWSEENSMSKSSTFKVLSDPVRRKILLLLRNGMLSAGEIAEQFELTNATISYHLKKLKEANLVFEEKDKQFIYYDINLSVLEEMILWFEEFKGGKENGKEKE